MNLTVQDQPITIEDSAVIKRQKKLAYMAGWRARNPNAKKTWDKANKSHVISYRKDYFKKIAPRRKAYMAEWCVKNATHRKSYRKAWKLKNPNLHRLQRRRSNHKRYNTIPHINLSRRMQKLLQFHLCDKAGRKTADLIGCSAQFFSKWIHSLFLPGMNFENRSEWHLDHIFPVACCGNTTSQILLAQNYRNIRPLWRDENRDKWCNITEDSILAGFICGITEIHLFRKGQASEDLIKMAEKLGFRVFRSYK